MKTRNDLCNTLRKTRERLGISQMELALKIGVDQNYISKVETGKINVSLDNFLKYIEAIGCSIRIKAPVSTKEQKENAKILEMRQQGNFKRILKRRVKGGINDL